MEATGQEIQQAQVQDDCLQDEHREACAQKHGDSSSGRARLPLTTRQLLVRTLAKCAAIVLAIVLALTFVIGVNVHYGNNMYPALRDGDLLVTLRLSEPHINDAVLYRHEGEVRAGRVVALEGHVVDISDQGVLTVNGIIPSEEVFYPTQRAEESPVGYPLTVGPGEVFILNDFRSDTLDSRTFGPVGKDAVDGTMLLVLRRRGF